MGSEAFTGWGMGCVMSDTGASKGLSSGGGVLFRSRLRGLKMLS